MKKMKLLSRNEMKKISGGSFCAGNLCWNYAIQLCDIPENVGEGCSGEYRCLTFCKDVNNNILNENQQLIVPSCDVAIEHCKQVYPTTTGAGCSCDSV